MSTEFPNQPDEPANRPPAREFPPPLPRQAEAVGWAPPPWANRPAAEPPSDPGSIAGWAPPPWTAGPDAPAGWSPDAADTRPFWRRIPAGWLIGVGLVLVGAAVAGWYFRGINNTATRAPSATVTVTTGPPDARAAVTQSADASRSASGESGWLGGNPHDYKLRVVDLRVGDCFDLKDESAPDEIEDIKSVSCTTEHEFEVFYVGAMGEGSYPTDNAFGRYVTRNCLPAFGAYIGKASDDSELLIYWLAPTDDAWRSGDQTVQCAAYYPYLEPLTRSLRGTRQ